MSYKHITLKVEYHEWSTTRVSSNIPTLPAKFHPWFDA